MSTRRQALGRWGEALAADYLSRHGYTILDRNVRTEYGELDLVARLGTQDGTLIVFVEVKTRRSPAYGLPENGVTPAKQAHLLAAAQAYLLAHPEAEVDYRIDVIAITAASPDGPPRLTHFENALR